VQKPISKLSHVGVSYNKKVPLFHGINLELMPGSFSFLTGVSGSGKSSFLKLLYLDLLPTWGSLTLLGREVLNLSWRHKAKLRQSIGIFFQEFRLLSHLSVIENVALPLRMRGLDWERSRKQAQELLNWVGVDVEAADLYPSSLSGGEKQRFAVVRAVISRPKLLLADEPTGNVDDKSALKLMHLFEELHKIGTTVVVATHNKDLIVQFPHPSLHLNGEGRLSSSDPYI